MKWYRLEGIPDDRLDKVNRIKTDSTAFVELPRSACKRRDHVSRTGVVNTDHDSQTGEQPSSGSVRSAQTTERIADNAGLVVKQLFSTNDRNADFFTGARDGLQSSASKVTEDCQHGGNGNGVLKSEFGCAVLDKTSYPLEFGAGGDKIHHSPSSHGQHSASPTSELHTYRHQKLFASGSHHHGYYQVASRLRHRQVAEGQQPHVNSINELWKQLTAINLQAPSDEDCIHGKGHRTEKCTCSQIRSLREHLPVEGAGSVSQDVADDCEQSCRLPNEVNCGPVLNSAISNVTNGAHQQINETSPSRCQRTTAEEQEQSVTVGCHTGLGQLENTHKFPVKDGQEASSQLAAYHIPTLLPLTLQDSFEQHMRHFIARSRARQEHILQARSIRLHERNKLASVKNEHALSARHFAGMQHVPYPPSVSHLHQPRRRLIDRREMVESTRRKCANLPEVRQRMLELKRQESYRLNRLRAKAFQQKVTQAALAKQATYEKCWW